MNSIAMPSLSEADIAIARALSEGNATEVQRVLSTLPMEAIDHGGESVLHTAAKLGAVYLCRAASQAQPQFLSLRDHFGMTPLMLACQHGKLEAALVLIPGSDLEARAQSGRSAFLLAFSCHFAGRHGSIEQQNEDEKNYALAPVSPLPMLF